MSQTQTIAKPCDYCGRTDTHLDDCPQRAHEFDGDPDDLNDFCGSCGHLLRDANHVVAIERPNESQHEFEIPGEEVPEEAGDSAEIGRVPDDDDGEIDGLITTTVDGTEARIFTGTAPAVAYPSRDVEGAIRELIWAREQFALFAQNAKEAIADKKASQERVNAAVDAVIEAMHAQKQPGLFG